jgi:hypothetical protein
VYWFSLPVVSDFIDQSSSSINEDKLVEAENLLIKTISAITEDYKKFYNGKVCSWKFTYRKIVECLLKNDLIVNTCCICKQQLYLTVQLLVEGGLNLVINPGQLDIVIDMHIY